ncbi:hypothetical protein [Microbacterium sp. Root553]|nr:hypothetical protein [Microbacterium sp. Root553]
MGRATGVGRAPLTAAARHGAWRAAALVALIAAATMPLMMAATFGLPL